MVERGGPLSHAAILARELGVPAVVNLPGACTALDGRLVTVDGDAGIVVVHDEDDEVVVHDEDDEVVVHDEDDEVVVHDEDDEVADG